jgi:hypothetical protein
MARLGQVEIRFLPRSGSAPARGFDPPSRLADVHAITAKYDASGAYESSHGSSPAHRHRRLRPLRVVESRDRTLPVVSVLAVVLAPRKPPNGAVASFRAARRQFSPRALRTNGDSQRQVSSWRLLARRHARLVAVPEAHESTFIILARTRGVPQIRARVPAERSPSVPPFSSSRVFNAIPGAWAIRVRTCSEGRAQFNAGSEPPAASADRSFSLVLSARHFWRHSKIYRICSRHSLV